MIEIHTSTPRIVRDVGAFFPSAVVLRSGELFVQRLWGSDRHPTEKEMSDFLAMNSPTDVQFWREYNEECRRLYWPDRVQVTNSYWSRSIDAGQTFTDWGMPPILTYAELTDNEVVGLSWYSCIRDGQLCVRSWHSCDGCKTWDAPYDIPLNCPPLEEDGAIYFHRSALHIKEDTYLTLVYGRLAGDEHDRVMIFRTVDSFKTLHYYSTVAVWHAGIESPVGFNESDFIRTPDGRILVVMRNDGFCSMYQAHSDKQLRSSAFLRLYRRNTNSTQHSYGNIYSSCRLGG